VIRLPISEEKESEMIEIGKYNELRILRETSVGLYLGDESGEDVLLPNKYCPEQYNVDDLIKVFVYRDYAERKIATNLVPKILLHEFALLKVSSIEQVGAFMDWGLEKGLLVPRSEQRQDMELGRWYIIYMDIDTETDRLFASNKLDKYLLSEILTVEEGEEVDLLVLQKTGLGYNVIINNIHNGLVFSNEVFRILNVGEKLKGFVKKIRDDKKIDISIHPLGYENSIDSNIELVFQKILENEGFVDVSDKSSPEKVYAKFGISKKAFKKAVGALYKQRRIEILPDGIKLI